MVGGVRQARLILASALAVLVVVQGGCATAPSIYQPETACAGLPAPRDAWDRILRSQKARIEFKKRHPCPATGQSAGSCPGWVIDHILPLKRGGHDLPCNMQWQTVNAAKAKDRTE